MNYFKIFFVSILIISLFLWALIITSAINITEPISESVPENLSRAIELYQSGDYENTLILLNYVKRQITADNADINESIDFYKVKHWHTQYVGEFVKWDLFFSRLGNTPLIGNNYSSNLLTLGEIQCDYYAALFANANNPNDIVVLFFNNDDYQDFQDLLYDNVQKWTVIGKVLPSGDTKTIPILQVIQFYKAEEKEEDNEEIAD